MSLEWFDRVCSELQDSLESICEQFDEFAQMTIERAAKHPRIECFVEDKDGERTYFSTLFFDPSNEIFYMESYDIDTEHLSRVILEDIEEIIDAVHEAFHELMDEYETNDKAENNLEEEIVVDVDWITPKVIAYQKMEEVEISYRFGVISETGDGVLHRLSRIKTDRNDDIEDESTFIFSKGEAGTIIDLIKDNMDAMEGFDHF
ncbi:hypothetical protein [Halalkalibacterium ligniniphilum]|uniref:hypothetical protein n=1 Tax=Halalkalibacterium ligniniphilum TaxID=1134413 RepID=UPI00034C5621|nr:hypothetical protein [Halalkalibacterium ligniniphilum]